MEINLKNIEELIFFDKKLQLLFPEFRHYFDQWQLGKRIPGMEYLGQRSVLDVLNSLDKERILKLETYFSDTILVDKLDNRLVVNFDCNLENCNQICEYDGYKDFCFHKDGNGIKVTFWR